MYKIHRINGQNYQSDIEGLAGSEDRWLANNLLGKIATKGDPTAQYRLAQNYAKRHNWTRAFRWFLAAAKNGHAEAQNQVGHYYAHGTKVDLDRRKSFKWFLKSAKQGNVNSQVEVAYNYKKGLGTPRDLEQAFKWYYLAASHGDAEALYKVGCSYLKGHGVDEDKSKAADYFNQAFEAGFGKAAYRRGELLKERGENVAAFTNFLLAANAGYTEAKYITACMLYFWRRYYTGSC